MRALGAVKGSSVVPRGVRMAVTLKQHVLKRSIERATTGTSASTIGLLVGDLDLFYSQVLEVWQLPRLIAGACACSAAKVPACRHACL